MWHCTSKSLQKLRKCFIPLEASVKYNNILHINATRRNNIRVILDENKSTINRKSYKSERRAMCYVDAVDFPFNLIQKTILN